MRSPRITRSAGKTFSLCACLLLALAAPAVPAETLPKVVFLTNWLAQAEHYLSNPAPGNALIKKDNPQMEDALLAFGLAKIEYGPVTGGDARTLGILAMTDARWKQTFDFMAGAGLVVPQTDHRKAYSLEFLRTVKVLP
jgi:NitT/TauT family transport system substrate-binding protein